MTQSGRRRRLRRPASRYKAPVTVIVFSNRSYNNERNRIWLYTGGDQLKLGRDMTCYNGNPDVDFAKASIAASRTRMV